MSSNTVSDNLRKIKELINTEDKWIKGFLAKTPDGNPVGFNHTDAIQFCVLGAVYRAKGTLVYCCKEVDAILKAAGLPLFFNDSNNITNLVLWNNDPTTQHHHVMEALDQAIADAEEAEREEALAKASSNALFSKDSNY